MLHEFLSANREELISRCREKVSRRSSPPVTPLELEHGVPLFLGQLVEALLYEQTNPKAQHDGILGSSRTASVESSRTAALHGKELLEEGYTVDQVVHGYGDVCQAITELAKERNALVTVGEFHTFNRLLDNAIADAVASYGHHRESHSAQDAQNLHERLGALADEQRRLLATALKAFEALKVGNLGLRGATGTFLEDTLIRLRDLTDKSLPEIRLSTGMTTPPNP
jgi:hypothetical protein